MVEFANRFEQRAWQRRAAAAWHCICILFLCTSSILNSAGAATFEVDDSDAGRADLPDIAPGDRNCQAANNLCTLRAAIEESNALAGLDRIELAQGHYVLSLGELRVSDSLTLLGADADSTIIDGCTRRNPATGRCTAGSRVLVIGPRPVDPGQSAPPPPNVTVANVTITGGLAPSFLNGAGIINSGRSFLVLMKTIVSNNVARQFGGGVTNSGSLQIIDSIIRDNTLPPGGGGETSSGGGVFNFGIGSLDITRSLITGNEATRGGGIRNAGGRLQIFNTTISGNTALARGGGILNSGIANIGFSTITLNRANAGASERCVIGGLTLNPCTFGGGIFNTGTTNVASTILAENTDNRIQSDPDFSPDCFSPNQFGVISFRNNVIGIVNDNCEVGDTIFGDLRFDQVGPVSVQRDGVTSRIPLDPGLEPLADNGGFSPTHKLTEDSPAIDAARFVTSARIFDCPATDQRDFVRPGVSSADCDVGAFEANAEPIEQLVALDIFPRWCPNVFLPPRRPRLRPFVQIGLLGSPDLDVSELDVSTLRLEGVRPSSFRAIRDVAAPFEPLVGKMDVRDCTRAGPDGFADLLLRFDFRSLIGALGLQLGEVAVVHLTGQLFDQTPVRGEDVVIFRRRPR